MVGGPIIFLSWTLFRRSLVAFLPHHRFEETSRTTHNLHLLSTTLNFSLLLKIVGAIPNGETTKVASMQPALLLRSLLLVLDPLFASRDTSVCPFP